MKMQNFNHKCSNFFYDLFDENSRLYRAHSKAVKIFIGVPLAVFTLINFIYHLFII